MINITLIPIERRPKFLELADACIDGRQGINYLVLEPATDPWAFPEVGIEFEALEQDRDGHRPIEAMRGTMPVNSPELEGAIVLMHDDLRRRYNIAIKKLVEVWMTSDRFVLQHIINATELAAKTLIAFRESIEAGHDFVERSWRLDVPRMRAIELQIKGLDAGTIKLQTMIGKA